MLYIPSTTTMIFFQGLCVLGCPSAICSLKTSSKWEGAGSKMAIKKQSMENISIKFQRVCAFRKTKQKMQFPSGQSIMYHCHYASLLLDLHFFHYVSFLLELLTWFWRKTYCHYVSFLLDLHFFIIWIRYKHCLQLLLHTSGLINTKCETFL